MAEQKGYLVFDIGTGNARVAVVTAGGEVTALERKTLNMRRIRFIRTDDISHRKGYGRKSALWQERLLPRALILH